MTDAERERVALDCEIKINGILLDMLIAQSPNPEELLRALQREIDQLSVVAAAEVHPEHVVELRARAEQRVNFLRKQMKPSASR